MKSLQFFLSKFATHFTQHIRAGQYIVDEFAFTFVYGNPIPVTINLSLNQNSNNPNQKF